METKFQTSFIPKKPLVTQTGINHPSPHKGTSFFMGAAVVIFILSLAAIGGAYGWKQILLSSQESYKNQLVERQKQFDLVTIQQLKEANIKIDLAQQILRNHLALSGIFDDIARLTIQNVRFLSLDVTAPNSQSSGVTVSLHGYGTNFQAVAFQSSVLASLEQLALRNVVKNPILSDPSLDTNGTVSFGLSATVDPSSLTYEKAVTGADASAPASDTASSTTP